MKRIIPFFITFLVVFLFYVKRIVILKYYPPICNLFFFLFFFISLFTKETVIQKIARTMEGNLTEKVKVYTRKLTYVWCCFTFLNFIVSVITIFMPDKVWIIYNGCISYILMGILFIGEYIVRTILKRKNII